MNIEEPIDPEIQKAMDNLMALSGFFRLDENHNPIPCKSFSEVSWEIENRRVGSDHVNGCWVSTVFLGMDHRHGDPSNAQPILFETMIFTKRRGAYSKCDEFQRRYCTWSEAERWHRRMVEVVKRKYLSYFSHYDLPEWAK